jgi:hypothetical protein
VEGAPAAAPSTPTALPMLGQGAALPWRRFLGAPPLMPKLATASAAGNEASSWRLQQVGRMINPLQPPTSDRAAVRVRGARAAEQAAHAVAQAAAEASHLGPEAAADVAADAEVAFHNRHVEVPKASAADSPMPVSAQAPRGAVRPGFPDAPKK